MSLMIVVLFDLPKIPRWSCSKLGRFLKLWTYAPTIPSPRLNFTFKGSTTANQPWLTINSLAIHGPQNPLPKHLEKLLPKFDPNNDILLEDHINKFKLTLNLMNVQHEDVACRLFYFTLTGNASSWFFNLSPRSITSWKQFENAFFTQFGDDKTSRTLFLDISRLRINKKE